MKINKTIVKALACVMAISAITSTSFAFFTDRAETSASGVAGSLDIEAEVNQEGKILIYPGKIYDLSALVRNTGSKSADIRIEVILNSDGFLQSYTDFLIDGQPLEEESGVIGNVKYEKVSRDTYYFESTVNGSIEKEEGIDTDIFQPNIQLLFPENIMDLNGSSMEVRVNVYAKQHRNTNDESWELIDFN